MAKPWPYIGPWELSEAMRPDSWAVGEDVVEALLDVVAVLAAAGEVAGLHEREAGERGDARVAGVADAAGDSKLAVLLWCVASQARPFSTAALGGGDLVAADLVGPGRRDLCGGRGWGWAGGGAAWRRAQARANAGVAASAKITGARRRMHPCFIAAAPWPSSLRLLK